MDSLSARATSVAGDTHGSRRRALEAAEVAWIALVPCAIATVAAVILLGPPLGNRLLAPSAEYALWPPDTRYIIGQPEPVKHARIALALLGPPLLALLVLATGWRRPRLPAGATRVLVLLAQLLALAFVTGAVLGQNNVLVPSGHWYWRVFPVGALAGGVVAALALLVAMRIAPVARRAARLAHETRTRHVACLVVAGALTACWLLTAVNSDQTTGRAAFSDLPPWAMGDTFAILDGRVPLVDFYPLYGQVWAYVVAVPMYLFGTTTTVFTLAMTTVSGIALLAVFSTFRRVARSSLLALALYLPFAATSFLELPFEDVVPYAPGERASNVQIFSVWPMRYAGPYLLAWLTARHLDGASPRRSWPLFLVGGLVAVNNLELGLSALAGVLAAVLCARPPRTRAAVARLAGELATGLAGAIALVAGVTLARSGRLPDPAFLFEYPRIFGSSGATGSPLPSAGFHLVLYATFTASLAVAAVRFVRGEQDRLLTGMIAWSGVFGLLSASYFAGNSDLFKLTALLSAWCFALALLVVVVARGLAARGWRRPGVPELLVLAGFGLAACSLAQVPAPWDQIARLDRTTATPMYAETTATRFVAAHTRPHEHVAILIPMGHRIARELRLVNVSPYGLLEAMIVRPQWSRLFDALHREGARKLFVPDAMLSPTEALLLSSSGLSIHARTKGYSEWIDDGPA